MSDSNGIKELNDIILYNGNEENFKQHLEDLNKKLNFSTIYSKRGNKKIKKYTGNLINGKYHGRGILYDEDSGKIKYDGYFKEGFYNGFGKEYNSFGRMVYIGFFSNNKYNGKGTFYYYPDKKQYEGNFFNGHYHGIGIEYLYNENRKRKLVYKEGKIENKCYGILYDENNKEEYKGLLINGKPEKGKSLTIYGENNFHILYKGDFSNFMYNGEGTLYYELKDKILFNGVFKDDKYFNGILYYDDGSKQYEGDFFNNVYDGNGTLYFKGESKKYYEGTFKEGEYKYGILYDPKGEIIYEGEFGNNNPKEGKDLKLYNFDGYLKFNGDIFDCQYTGIGKLYSGLNKLSYEGEFKNGLCEENGIFYGDNNEIYKGEFKNGKIHGFGRLYETDKYFRDYLYYEGNFIENEISGKGIKFYVDGSKKIEGIFESIDSYEGKYYNPEREEIYNGKIINEIPMNFKGISLYNDLGFKVYDGKIYNGGYTNKEIVFPFKHKERWEKINVIFLSKGFPGKTCLIRRIEGKEFPKEMTPETVWPELIYFKYQYNNNKYELELYDTTGMERFKPISLLYARRCELIIYIFI